MLQKINLIHLYFKLPFLNTIAALSRTLIILRLVVARFLTVILNEKIGKRHKKSCILLYSNVKLLHCKHTLVHGDGKTFHCIEP